MKKIMKVSLIIASIFLLAGILLSIAGVSMGAAESEEDIMTALKDNNIIVVHNNGWTGEETEEQQLVYTAENIEELEIDLKYQNLILREGDQDEIEVYMNSLNDRMRKVFENSGKLKIEDDSRISNGCVIVSYPKGTKFDKIDLDVDAGEVILKGDLSADELKISVGAGTLGNQGKLQTEKLDLEVGAGEIDVRDLTANQIEAECGLGELRMELAEAKENYNYKMECGMGSIEIDGEELISFTGEKTIKNDGAKKNMDLECGMGEISVTFR